MRLYHGSNTKIAEIDLAKCRPYRDFGKGFYLTTLAEQAARMAKRTVRLYGGHPNVSTFEFDANEAESLKMLMFTAVSQDWAQFVINNRLRSFRDFTNPLSNHDNKYDIVFGPVANDDLALLFRQFSDGIIDLDTLSHGLESKQLNNQFSFHTPAGIALLHPIVDADDQ
jgi:hypothetical protein